MKPWSTSMAQCGTGEAVAPYGTQTTRTTRRKAIPRHGPLAATILVQLVTRLSTTARRFTLYLFFHIRDIYCFLDPTVPAQKSSLPKGLITRMK